jgi:hypothetical protein
MKNIFGEIFIWASTLSYWEQVTLSKLLSGKQLSNDDYQEILTYFLEDKSLIPKNNTRKPIVFNQSNIEKESLKNNIVLKEISNLENVNALIPNQHIPFGNHLTAIYGLNGAGKSGYVRVLGSAGFTRGDREVLPDITKELNSDAVISAKITTEIDGVERTIDHKIGRPCLELSTFYIFDSTSVKVHVVGKNTFSFSPAGLSILTDLATETDVVRQLLKQNIQESEKISDFEKYFTEVSEIQELVKNINSETDYDNLEKIALLSSDEEKRIHELEVEIGKIGLGQHKSDIEEKKRNYATLQKLYGWIQNLIKRTNMDSISASNECISELVELTERAKVLSLQSFKNDKLSQTGSQEWHEFMRSAYSLAKAEGKENVYYPTEEQPCLLCQQPLSIDSVNLIRRIWIYLDEQVQSSINTLRDTIGTISSNLTLVQTYFASEDYFSSLALLNSINPNLGDSIQKQVSFLLAKNVSLISNLSLLNETTFADSNIVDYSSTFTELLSQIQNSITELEGINLETKSQKLNNERRFLLDRKKVHEILPQIKEKIEKCKWANKAKSVIGSTRHITQKHNSLFDELVRDRYIEIFTGILTYLDRPLQVEIFTSGQKGESVKQIQLKAHKSASEIASTEKVLSEGEKRAVALADFITEATLDTNSNGIILDDPVTSLDFEWRHKIASFLVEEAKNRQVIVFTHDLPFLYLLLSYSEEQKVENRAHWIMRMGVENTPGYVLIDNCPPLEKNSKTPKIAESFYTRAIDANGEEQQYLLSSGFGHLRTCYEVMVIYDLFGGVVRRFEDRVRMGTTLTNLVWDKDILEEINSGFERLSRYIDAHSHSDPMSVQLKTDTLFEEIASFKLLQAKVKKLKKDK